MARANYCPTYNCVIKSETCPYCNEQHGQQITEPQSKGERLFQKA